ncbi:MAG TPA: two-component sensor histidine kinase, partial [Catalimonadaceae bacterium]|nr:two-component sensor histidine kinase [Catalimonadaceae bacterium]
MEIRTRLTLQFFLMVATILMVSFFFIYFIIEQNRQNSFYERLNNKAITAAELLFRVDRVDSSLLKLIDRTER